jgi:hypothetical protein
VEGAAEITVDGELKSFAIKLVIVVVVTDCVAFCVNNLLDINIIINKNIFYIK